MSYAADLAQRTGAYGLMPTFTYGFAEAFKAFGSWLDDALVYLGED